MTDDKNLYDPVLISAIRQDMQDKPFGYKVTELNIANNLVEKIAELLNAEVHYSYLLNHKGEEKRKISIIYKEE